MLLDLTMPGVGGVEVFREMRSLRPDVRSILMSGYNEQDATQRFVGKGLAGFISKPFLITDLLTRIEEALDQAGPEAEQKRLRPTRVKPGSAWCRVPLDAVRHFLEPLLSPTSGKRTVKSEPLPRTLSSVRLPSWACTICLTIARPNPVPPFSAERALSTR